MYKRVLAIVKIYGYKILFFHFKQFAYTTRRQSVRLVQPGILVIIAICELPTIMRRSYCVIVSIQKLTVNDNEVKRPNSDTQGAAI